MKKDAAFIDTLKQMRKRLPPMHIGQYGQLQEWLDDIDDPKDNHRHISHLYGLFPSNQISPYRTPELYNAAKNTLIQRGDVSTGWSMGWKVNWWARMLDGNHAYKLIQNQLSPVLQRVRAMEVVAALTTIFLMLILHSRSMAILVVPPVLPKC